MSVVDQVRTKVQRILTDNFGKVEIDRDNDFVVRKDSAVTFIRIREGFGDDGAIIEVKCPLLMEVTLTKELFQWVATEGQRYKLGSVYVNPDDNGKTGWVYFRYAIIGQDLDESELMTAVGVVLVTSDELDNELQEKFGGELFGE